MSEFAGQRGNLGVAVMGVTEQKPLAPSRYQEEKHFTSMLEANRVEEVEASTGAVMAALPVVLLGQKGAVVEARQISVKVSIFTIEIFVEE